MATTIYNQLGSREICDVAFKAKSPLTLGGQTFEKDETVLFIESAKTSSLEGDATTVYATGGKGNNKLLAWEGEKSITYTVEDALLSPASFALLSGAGLSEASEENIVHYPMTIEEEARYQDGKLTIDLTSHLNGEVLCKTQKAFGYTLNELGQVNGKLGKATFGEEGNVLTFDASADITDDTYIRVEFYVIRLSDATVIEIEPDKFAGYYYVEAKTLYRQQNGVDIGAVITIPKVKIQSKFSLSMSATGDPSTFTFTMDAFPDYTKFNRKKKCLLTMTLLSEKTEVKEEVINCNHGKGDFMSVEQLGGVTVKDNVLSFPVAVYNGESITPVCTVEGKDVDLVESFADGVVTVVLTNEVATGDKLSIKLEGAKNSINVPYTLEKGDAPTE